VKRDGVSEFDGVLPDWEARDLQVADLRVSDLEEGDGGAADHTPEELVPVGSEIWLG
jgi:hypothetical protein